MIVRPIVCRSFIARREELAFLNERRLLAAKSHGGVALIVGDAGVGKSRLLAEFCAGLAKSRWRVGQAACLEQAQRPYDPVLTCLSALDGSTTPLLPEATKGEQFEAIARRFGQAAKKTGLVVVIEDIHWADTATLELLAFLTSKFERMRVLLVASFRPHHLAADRPAAGGLAKLMRVANMGRIDLAPLDAADLRRFVDETLEGFVLPDETRRAVARTSEGNPFFAEELLKSAVERRTTRTPGERNEALPSSLRAVVLERWNSLSDPERRVLAQAAVIGRSFELQLLARTLAAEPHALLPTLQRARDLQLVEEGAASLFRFRHALTREAIYAEFLGEQVRPLHRTIALTLENGPEERRSLEGLAYHFWAAGETEQAARYNELAGDGASGVHAHDDAIAFYERALESPLVDDLARAGISEKIAHRYVALSLIDRAQETYSLAAALFGQCRDYEGEARCRVRAAVTGYTRGHGAPVGPLEEMLDRLDAGDYVARSRVHLGIAWLAASSWFPTKAAFHIRQVDARALVTPDIETQYHNVVAWISMSMGDLAAFRREHAAWIESAGRTGRTIAIAGAHYNGAACYSMFGEHEEAFRHISMALKIGRAALNKHIEESTHALSAFCFLMSGDLIRARAAVKAVRPTTDNEITIAHAAEWGTLVGVHLDDQELISTWFDGAGAAVLEAPGAGFAEVLIRRGRPAEARAFLQRATLDCERPRGNLLTMLAIAKYGLAEDLPQARAQLAAGADSPHDLPERHALALFDAYVARREGRDEHARRLARSAAAGLGRLRFPLLAAAAHEAAGDLPEALALYHATGAVGDERRMRAVSSGAVVPEAPRTNGTALLGLSPREAQIAELVAQGESNVAIARRLAISHKTVEKHLGSIYQKLHLSKRTQLAAQVGANG